MCSDGSEGRRISSPTGLTDRVKGGQIWASKSLPEKPAGEARLLFRMAPLRLAGRPVPGDLSYPPSGPLAVLTPSRGCRPKAGVPSLGAAFPETGNGPPRGGPSSSEDYSCGSFELGGNITSSWTATGKSSLRLKNSDPSPLRVLRNIAPTRWKRVRSLPSLSVNLTGTVAT